MFPVAIALVAAGQLAEAWEAFDEYYEGNDAASNKSWLQHVLLTRLPWRHQSSLSELAGVWIGEVGQFVRIGQRGEFEGIGGGHMIVISLTADGPIGWPVGWWTNLGRGDRVLTCTLLRGPDRPHHRGLWGDCDDDLTLHIYHQAGGTLFFDHVGSHVHEDVRYEGHAVRREGLEWLDAARLTPRMLKPEQLFASSCVGLHRSRNEIFARLGWVFEPGTGADHFTSQAWYRPRGHLLDRDAVNTEVVADLTEAERVDVRTLLAYERQIGCVGTPHPDPALRVGPSFECGAVVQWDERLICSKPALSEFDVLVAAVQAEVVTSLPAHAEPVLEGQHRWFERRLECQAAANHVACVRQQYVARLDELRVLMVSP